MKSKKLLAMGLTVVLAAMSLAGCKESAETEENKAEADTGINLEEVLSSEPTGEKIVVATNNTGDGRDAWLAEEIKAAGFNAEIVPLGAGDITARVISEVNNPTINVVWGPSEDQFISMIDAGALAEFTPEWAEQVAGVSEENGYSWPYEIQPKLLVCNPDIYTEETAPKSFRDLWENEEFHGKYAVPTDFGGNTNRAVIGGILGQYLDENGDLGVSDEGWEAIEAYFDNGYKTPKGENDFENMASGKVPITFTYASGLKGKCESFDIEPIIVYSEDGEPSNTNQVGVVANTNQEVVEEAMRFANWIGSAEVIGDFASENGNMVANKEAEDMMVPMIKEIKENYKPEDVDWTYINSKMDEWVAKIQLEIY